MNDEEPPSLRDKLAGEIFRTGGVHGVELAEALIRDVRAQMRAASKRATVRRRLALVAAAAPPA